MADSRVGELSDSDNFVEISSDSSEEENEVEPFSQTLSDQLECEQHVKAYLDYYNLICAQSGTERAELTRETHVKYLLDGLEKLPTSYQSLDASRPWIAYWILHSLELLDALPPQSVLRRVVNFLKQCQSPAGGFGGGPGQIPHLAPTYAAINALAIIGTEEAYSIIDRESLYKWMLSLKHPDGGFRMHWNGEVDVRGTYCALATASLVNILTPELMEGAAEFVARCQTYEGGIGGEPGNEAHGGYAFCGFAALVIMQKTDLIDLPALLHWAVHRQMSVEGGFQGRTNKLVDGCYSFWQCALFPLLDRYYINASKYKQHEECNDADSASNTSILASDEGGWMFDQKALQKYVLVCTQDKHGGLKDKPGKYPDYYHTCYCLSGLSVAQHNPIHYYNPSCILGKFHNLVSPTDPVHNISPEAVQKAKLYFSKLPLVERTEAL